MADETPTPADAPEPDLPPADDDAADPDPPPEYEKHLTPRQKRFLAAYEVLGVVTAASKAAKVHATAPYEWSHKSVHFAVAFREAKLRSDDNLMFEARRRAMKSSDRLMERFLEARFPEFRRRQDINVRTDGGRASQDMAAMNERIRQNPRLAAKWDELAELLAEEPPIDVQVLALPEATTPPPPAPHTNGNGHIHG